MSTFYFDPGPDRSGNEHFATGRKVMLATTAYDSPDASYTFAIGQSRAYLADRGIMTAYALLSGDCHVDDARNRVVAHFLDTDCSDLVFIDADVSWEPQGLLDIIRTEGDIVGAVYPHRQAESDRGQFPAAIMEGRGVDHLGRLQMEHLPTGFVRISRRVLEGLDYKAEHYHTQAHSCVGLLFSRQLASGGNGQTYGRIGGDVSFFRRAVSYGFDVFALPHVRLGHAYKGVRWDSLTAMIRWRNGTVLRDICQMIRAGKADVWEYREARDWVGNRWGANAHVLAYAVGMARKAKGPIVEAGSGLTTVLMAAATDQMVYCLEHDPHHAEATKRLAHEAGVTANIAIVHAPLVGGWYDPREMEGLPSSFAFGLIDGPPRAMGCREYFTSRIACDAILADNEGGIDDYLREFAAANGWQVTAHDARAILIEKG